MSQVNWSIVYFCSELFTSVSSVETLNNIHCSCMRHTQAFFGNFGSEIQIGNQQVWGKNWGLKVVINKFSMENLEKKDLNFKFKVWWIENRTKSFQPHQGLALLVVLELVWSSDFLSIISKIGKLWNLFSSISLVDYHFIHFSLVGYHFFSKMSQLHNIIDVSINENQLVMTNFDKFCHIHQH